MADQDFDIKEALVRSLRENGILPKLQAQLKAAVYLALEKHNYEDGLPPINPRIRTMLSSEDGLIIASLMADFLTQMDLNNTINVLKHELQMEQLSLLDRESLCSMLGLRSSVDDAPILTTLVKSYKSLRSHEIDREGSGLSLDHDDAHIARCSKIPILQNRKANAPMSHPPSEFRRIPNGGSNLMADESSHNNLPLKDPSYANAKLPPNSHDSGRAESGNTEIDNSDRILNHTTNGSSTSIDQTLRVGPNGISSPTRPESKAYPRDQEYGDDFESPRSQESHTSLSNASRSGDMNSHEKKIISKNNPDAKSMPSFLVDMRTNQVVRMDGTSSPLSGTISESSLNCNDKLILRSGTNSPSVIRVYAPARRRTPSNEASSDVDDDEDEEEEEIPEVLKQEDSESDTIDQTVDSEQSLKLDYMEDIQSPQRSITPTPAL